ncbi:MAG TPA: tRNA preQ1(34) S-adenosylmethionine ribosyltransferase-isomerase QueA [Planctomycetota bacterium]|nr:tRNA preQ1(34) S-adenosylmethionine ribosyltransferase-isomerase QueA [Planctomycetota bacterium]
MRPDEFDYALPPERIAAEPVSPRDAARLLVLGGVIEDRRVGDLPDLLEPGDLLVVNDTKVRRARLFGRRATGGKVELLLLKRLEGGEYETLARAHKRLRPGETVPLDGGLLATLLERPGGGAIWRVRIEGGSGGESVEETIDRVGHVPLPPYVKRPDRPEDRESYQTIFAERLGSAAAPTAGLHFTPGLLERLRARGVGVARITLHVGYGTFAPIEAERVEDHRLHAEEFEVTEEAAAAIRGRRGRLVAVGTTTTRVLESLARTGGIRAAKGTTDLFLYPGCEFHAIDGLLTNFHLPKSTLLMLVCAFAGQERVLGAYAHALRGGYRFFSYGDAMLVWPGPRTPPALS